MVLPARHRVREDCHRGLNWSISPTAATTLAVSTQRPQEAIDHLNGTENHLDTSYDQQDGEKGQIPGHHVFRLLAHAPQVFVCEVVPVLEGVAPGAIAHETFRTFVDGYS